METPFFGPFDVTRSTNVADNILQNLFPELVDDKDGKNVGALYGTPGLTLLSEVGDGPINGERTLANTQLYVVSGNVVYSLTSGYVATNLGVISGSGGRVCIVDSGTQIAFFTDTNCYVGPVGFPLVSGTISAGGINYAVDDQIVLSNANGTQTAAAIIKVTGVTAGAVTAFVIIQTGAFPSTPTSFGQQITTGSGSGFILSAPTFGGTQALCQVFLPFAPPGGGQQMSATFQDGFVLVGEPGTMTIWQSLSTDISVYPPLNFAFANGESDYVVALYSIHREVFVVKNRTTEVWNNAGTAGFAFQPLAAVLIEHGAVAWGTVARAGDTLLMLAQSSQGDGTVIGIEGFRAGRVSTHAVETLIANAGSLTNAFAYTYLQEGHQLYVLTINDLTLVYDQTTSRMAGIPMWYLWGYFSNGATGRHRGNAFSFFNETLVLGDYQNGNLYSIDLSALTDNGQPIQRMRSWRALQKPTMQPVRFSSVELDLQTGVDVVTTAPQIVLDWSDDGGHNWSNQMIMAAGVQGQTARRVRANRLGSTKRNGGLDRIFRIQTTDAFGICFIGAEINV